MKIGDRVICIKEVLIERKSRFIPDRYYFIRDIEIFKDKTMVQVEDIWFVIQNISDLHFHTYFATIAEYREKRMTEIIEDE
jgi:hypothetical protein